MAVPFFKVMSVDNLGGAGKGNTPTNSSIDPVISFGMSSVETTTATGRGMELERHFASTIYNGGRANHNTHNV